METKERSDGNISKDIIRSYGGNDVKCFSCGKKEHIATRCPAKALFCMNDRLVGFPNVVTKNNKLGGDIYRTDIVEGIPVTDILLIQEIPVL